MRVIKNGEVLEDGWQRVADDAPLPEGDVLVSVRRWQAEREALLARAGRVGLIIEGDTSLADIAPDLPRFGLVALDFPKFADGRCFSQAVLLRTRLGYKGELRAVGDVLRDQIFFMHRCGIDAYAVREDKDPRDALKGLADFSLVYQPSADHLETVADRRAGRHGH